MSITGPEYAYTIKIRNTIYSLMIQVKYDIKLFSMETVLTTVSIDLIHKQSTI